MEQVSAAFTANDPELMTMIGVIASRLLTNLPETPKGSDTRREVLLERALMYAAQAEQQLASQSARIEYLESLSITDELTGLLNRRGFTEELGRALAKARRYDTGGVLVYCDLDDFKFVNDQYGHCAGDAVLRHVAEVSLSSLREVDTVARLGGDEFAMLIDQARCDDGVRRAQTLQWQIETMPCEFGGRKIPITISMGIEPFGAEDAPDDLIRRADTSMYYTKRYKKSPFDKLEKS